MQTLSETFQIQVHKSNEEENISTNATTSTNTTSETNNTIDSAAEIATLEYNFTPNYEEEELPLLVDEMIVNEQGLLLLHFNQPLAIPTIYKDLGLVGNRMLSDNLI